MDKKDEIEPKPVTNVDGELYRVKRLKREKYTEIRNSEEKAEVYKAEIYPLCKEELDEIMVAKITDTERIENLFEVLFDFYEDKRFYAMYWLLIRYVEFNDLGLGAFYRRLAKVLETGI